MVQRTKSHLIKLHLNIYATKSQHFEKELEYKFKKLTKKLIFISKSRKIPQNVPKVYNTRD